MSDNQATILGIETVASGATGVTDGANYANVHATLFDATSQEVFDFSLCLSPNDFGFIILQRNPASGAQLDGLGVHGQKITAVSVAADHISDIGFYGTSRTINNRKVPHFQLVLGGKWTENADSYGLAMGSVPAKNIPDVLDRVTESYV